MKTHVMKTILILFVLSSVPAFADDPIWTGDGTYTFDDNSDPFIHGSTHDTVTLNIIGGAFNILYCYDESRVNMSGGDGYSIGTNGYSILNLSGGSLTQLTGDDSSLINIYVSDYLVTQGAYYYNLSGHWENGSDFDILINDFSWPHVSIHVIPEPCALSLLVFGSVLIRKRMS